MISQSILKEKNKKSRTLVSLKKSVARPMLVFIIIFSNETKISKYHYLKLARRNATSYDELKITNQTRATKYGTLRSSIQFENKKTSTQGFFILYLSILFCHLNRICVCIFMRFLTNM